MYNYLINASYNIIDDIYVLNSDLIPSLRTDYYYRLIILFLCINILLGLISKDDLLLTVVPVSDYKRTIIIGKMEWGSILLSWSYTKLTNTKTKIQHENKDTTVSLCQVP